MKTAQSTYRIESRDITSDTVKMRKAVGYIRVSTDMQAADGLSLDAQTAAIEQYCTMQGLRLVRICRDVISGAKASSGLDGSVLSVDASFDGSGGSVPSTVLVGAGASEASGVLAHA